MQLNLPGNLVIVIVSDWERGWMAAPNFQAHIKPVIILNWIGIKICMGNLHHITD